MNGIEAVIFDLDGSLVDSMWIWKDIDIDYLGRFGLVPPPDLSREIEGKSFSETAAYFKERFSLPDSVEQIKAAWNRMAWDKYMNEVPLKDGVGEYLDWCLSKNIRLGIATSNSRELVNSIARVHGLEHVFQCIMTSCDVGRGKPAPDIYLAVAGQLGIPPRACLVFEDIIPGILAGKNRRKKKRRLPIIISVIFRKFYRGESVCFHPSHTFAAVAKYPCRRYLARCPRK